MLSRIADAIDGLNARVGKVLSWLVLFMVAVTFTIVVLRYFFNTGWVWMQEFVLYMHALVFLGACGTTLLKDQHVRVDIFYRGASKKYQAWVNALGAICLLMPMCWVIGLQSVPYVSASWEVFEGSKDGGGLEAVFILKTFILLFVVFLFLQGLSLLIRSVETLREKTHA